MNKGLIILIVILLIVIAAIVFIVINKGNKNETAYIEINCDGKDLSKEYKKGDAIDCTLLGSEFKLTIEDIKKDEIEIHADKYGLFPERDNGTISLIDKVDDFTLEKDKDLILALQATDVSSSIKLKWTNKK